MEFDISLTPFGKVDYGELGRDLKKDGYLFDSHINKIRVAVADASDASPNDVRDLGENGPFTKAMPTQMVLLPPKVINNATCEDACVGAAAAVGGSSKTRKQQ